MLKQWQFRLLATLLYKERKNSLISVNKKFWSLSITLQILSCFNDRHENFLKQKNSLKSSFVHYDVFLYYDILLQRRRGEGEEMFNISRKLGTLYIPLSYTTYKYNWHSEKFSFSIFFFWFCRLKNPFKDLKVY